MSDLQSVMFSTPKGREIGMLMAEAGAERADPGWGERAYLMLQCFLAQHQGEFLAEEARGWAYRNGLTQTKNNRAWGPVMLRACKEGLVVCLRKESTVGATAHGANAAVWIKKP